MLKRWVICGVWLIVGVIFARTDDELPTIYELIKGHPEFGLFAQAIEQDGRLLDLLNDAHAELTIFVPTDQTIRSWLRDQGNLPDRMFLERDDLHDLLKYSIVQMAVDYHVLLDYPYSYLMSLLDERGLLIQQVDASLPVYINFSLLDDRYFASNGIVYLVLDDLIIPPAPLFDTPLSLSIDEQTVVEFIAQSDQLTVFYELLEASPTLLERLNTDQPYTLFAPNDEAVQRYLDVNNLSVTQLIDDEKLLTDFLHQHIIGGQIRLETIKSAIQLLDGMDFKILNLALDELTFTITQAGVMVNGASFVSHNHQLLNGRVHVIDGVIE
jgi:uncharacterized surface protein with fasciclin (FAS1) repeats